MNLTEKQFETIEKETGLEFKDIDKSIINFYSDFHNGFVSTDIEDYNKLFKTIIEYVNSEKGLKRLMK